ncbi:iron-siderophore ABC transporter substrate-binding protein [Marinobacter nanhaiticus D15-8W]|uniref:Iron-siderophore ABC transporter substrate-binding protein n=1 Tax=Marinobacter nanhaiticus D15-8W TaxID=626887 RepID=N6W4J2_9GAMM|nr:iron-siderophore ABC transporter substrate-binding protein [Marinobacter nanhaiticus]ENO15064.1 iron-siderophore ABC transporter substrate-binding protein [Marinobacter nanhaiticus D15-8W]BES69237.1 iron-siderophore ABC transporter substrate-binding protein [Marinobacter nanhaiticus D15-8W]
MVVRCLLRLVVLSLGLLASFQTLAVTVTDARGEHTFDSVPQRIVTISWAMTENALELGIEPVGVADIEGYTTWVVRPPIPEGVADIGKRQEPSIERLAELEPDVIILSNGQEGLVDKLSQIAPVLYFDAFSAEQDNAETARDIFMEMARLFGKEALAREKLNAMDAEFGELESKLHAHFGETLPEVTGVRFFNQAIALVYGSNSMSQAALNKMGIQPAMTVPASQWGFAQRKIIELSKIKDGALLYFKPAPGVEDLFDSPLWQAMPVARAGRVAPVESTWSYGGALSVLYLARAQTEALLTIDPQ